MATEQPGPRHSIWAYPWDVLDDPAAADEIASLGLDGVSLAASYHTTRALLPHNPHRVVLDAAHAAVYFEPDRARYRGARLTPAEPSWVPRDSFGLATDALRAAGQRITAWTVVLHNSRLGGANQELTLQNAFGDRYVHALCPAQPEVRAYAATLVGDLIDRYVLDGVELEACGYMGYEHLSHHEKFGVRLDLLGRFLLSVCFCEACQSAMRAADLDPDRLRARVIESLRGRFAGVEGPADTVEDADAGLSAWLGEHDAHTLFSVRDRVTIALLDAVTERARARNVPVTVTAAPSRYEAGAAIGTSLGDVADRAENVLYPLFGMTAATADAQVDRLRAGIDGAARLLVGLRAFAPDVRSGGDLAAATRRLAARGVDGFRYYHYGLCPRPNLGWIREVAGG